MPLLIHFFNHTSSLPPLPSLEKALLKRPMVQIALHCWAGTTTGLSEKDMAAVTKDEGVITIYPRIREFETLCRRANLPFATGNTSARASHPT